MNFPAKNFSGRKKLLQHSLVARVSSPEKRHVDREGSCLLAVKMYPFWFHVVLKLNVNPQGSHLLFWHPKGSYNNDPYSFSMEDTPLDSNKLQDRCVTHILLVSHLDEPIL